MSKTISAIQNKIFSITQFKNELSSLKSKNKKIVFTNGCFDIIHRGHVEYLAQSSDLGDILILGLNSDSSVKRIKGNDRPINDQFSRAIILASLEFIDYVVFFDEDTPYNLIKIISPDILVKGNDYKIKEIIGHDIVLKNGGEVKTIKLVEGFSTSKLIKKINQK